MGTSSKALARKLQKLAKRQHGCFTAAQAIEVGYADSVHLYHVKTGTWLRIFRGVYRLDSFPETPESRGMAALLWTRDKSGKIMGVLAEETANAIRSGNLPPDSPIHVAVEKGFRRSSNVPAGISISILNHFDHKPSKFHGLPAIAPLLPGSPPPEPPLFFQDMADYYDFLDYHSNRCPANP